METQIREQASTQHCQQAVHRGVARKFSEQSENEYSGPGFRRSQLSHHALSAGMDIQTPITIQASSPTLITTPGYMRSHADSLEEVKSISQDILCGRSVFTEQKEQVLIQTYLERVNPRYPFLHEETFLTWYRSWKTFHISGSSLPIGEQRKAFFIQMVFWVSLPVTAQVSPEERHLSNVRALDSNSRFTG